MNEPETWQSVGIFHVELTVETTLHIGQGRTLEMRPIAPDILTNHVLDNNL